MPGKKQKDPGTGGGGEYYRIVVRPKSQFTTFRYQDVGDPGHIQRLAGKRKTGTWADHAWLISKEDAHLDGDTLVPDTQDAKDVIATLGSKPVHKKVDVFSAKPRKNVPEKDKPTAAQKKARIHTSKKAQAAQ